MVWGIFDGLWTWSNYLKAAIPLPAKSRQSPMEEPMNRKLIFSASAMAIVAPLTLSIPAHAADYDGAYPQLVAPQPPPIKALGWQDTLSLDDWLKLLATQRCEHMQNHEKYETLDQCVKAEAKKLDEHYQRIHEASFHMY
jgi:hypothetical protein